MQSFKKIKQESFFWTSRYWLLFCSVIFLISVSFAVIASQIESNQLSPDDFLSANIIRLSSESSVPSLADHWQVFVNEQALSPEEIFAQVDSLEWKIESQASVNYEYDHREYWFRFRIIGEASEPQDFIIDVAYPLLDELELFHLKDNTIIKRSLTGDHYLFEQRDIRHQNFLFPVSVDATHADIYLRVKTSSTLQVPITIWPTRDFWQVDKINTYMDGVFFGGIFIMVLYNFFIFLSVKDRAYLFYVLYMLSLLLVQAANRGIGYQLLWPYSPFFQNVVIVPSLAGVVVFASLFFISLLDLKTFHPKLNRIFVIGILLTTICAFSQVYFPYSTALKLTALAIVLIGLLGLLVALKLWMNGNRLAGYYIAGWGALIFAFMIYIASVFDLIPRTFFVEYVTMMGGLAEVIIFSFALADRINFERRMRIESQAALLEAQQEINRKLDIRVQQRTKELEIANAKLQEMSFSDGLTGVKNRRYFDERIVAEYKRAFREQKYLALLMLDIDHFKDVNDQHGHQIGDDCLVEVARIFKKNINRPGDTLYRYGGEEFSVLLPETDLKGAELVAEKLRTSMEQVKVYSSDGQLIPIRISVGVASYVPTLRTGVDNLIKRADEQLYRAKREGRNRVCSSEKELDA